MEIICTIFIGLLLVAGCGNQYHTLTLINEAQTPLLATLYANDNQKMSAFCGETEQQIFEQDTYVFQISINYFEPETVSRLFLDTIDLDHNITCTVSDTGEMVIWE